MQASASQFVGEGHCHLAEDSLFPQPCFQFLYPLFFNAQKLIMLHIRKCYEVFRPIVIFDAIQMMGCPAFRQWFVVCQFPIENMFAHVAGFFSSWMLRLPYIDVALLVSPSPSPITRMRLTHLRYRSLATPPFKLHGTASTPSSFWINWLATIKASISSSTHAPIVSYYGLAMQGVQ